MAVFEDNIMKLQKERSEILKEEPEKGGDEYLEL
jgi:hypothetical protein